MVFFSGCKGHDHWFHCLMSFFKNTSKEFIIVSQNERDFYQESTVEPRFKEGPCDVFAKTDDGTPEHLNITF